MRTDINGTALDVFDEGSGEPVLLVHGFPDSHDVYRHQVKALVQAGYRAITFDLRGFGGSDKPTDTAQYTPQMTIADIAGVLDAVGVDRAHLVGHDWGAMLSWTFATAMPDRVTSLTALSLGHLGAYQGAGWEQKEKAWYVLQFQNPLVEQWLLRDGAANFRDFFSQHPDIDRVVEAVSGPGALTAALALYRAWAPPEALLAPPVEFPKLTLPVLGVHGVRDPYLTEKQMADSEKYVSGYWRYESLPDVGHWLTLEVPDRVNELILDFLAGQQSSV
jgi:pimeloyl-ACP methyl ester carboxylesterase